MDKLSMHTSSLADNNFSVLVGLFPNAVTETIDENGEVIRAIDADMLAQEINARVVLGAEERYQFTWPDKHKSILLANSPIAATLRPCREESVDFDKTENLYVEGDNLDVLKLMLETYLSKVKMIYIDPPYNTGGDFLYNDDFSEAADSFLTRDGQFDDEGNRMIRNLDSNGRFHTDWLNMIYPRLRLARDLLRDDGVIFISIDDAEVGNLRKICNEVFGEKNFVACLVYDKNRKNDAKYFSVGHEYMLVYFKSAQTIYDMGIILRAGKEGVDEVKTEFERLRELYNDDWAKVNEGLKELYSSWPKGDERRSLARFTKVDERGPYRDDGNINWPGGNGPKYEVLHPVTGKPCKKPISGWRYPTLLRLQEEIDKGRVVFGADETTVPRVRMNLFDSDKEVMRSVIFSYAQTATQEFNKLFDDKRLFENPKSINDIKKLVEYITSAEDDDIIMDFFSGSATTAHAVMQLNAEDGGRRKFIMVQIPEIINEDSDAFKEGYKNISEIGKERIRRAGSKIKEESPLTTADLDIGFRVLKVDSSNMKDVYYTPDKYELSLFETLTDNIKEDRSPEDLLFQVMLELGVLLSSKIETILIGDKVVFSVAEGYLIACFDSDVNDDVITEIAKQKPYYAVFRDASFASDSVAANFEQIFEAYSPTTIRKVL
jgi:adenine-specific DNA-methyltransferase